MGACCFPNGSCALSFQDDCVEPAIFFGDFRVCEPDLCPPPRTIYAILANGRGAGVDTDAVRHVREELLRYPAIRDENIKVVTSAGQVQRAFETLGSRIRPGDTLLFYYVGHGTYDINGTEPEIVIGASHVLATLWSAVGGGTAHLFNGGEEYLDFVPGEISDDLLANWMRQLPHSEQIQKIAVLSSCFAGGFWGQEGSVDETGDLDTVPRMALIAAVREIEPATGGPGDGRPYFSKIFESSLHQLAPGPFSFDQLVAMTRSRHTAFTNDPPAFGIVFPDVPWLHQEVTIPVVIDEMNPDYRSTPDFDGSAELMGNVQWCGPAVSNEPDSIAACPQATPAFSTTIESTTPVVYRWQREVFVGPWTLQTRLTANPGAPNLDIGEAIALSGDTMVVTSRSEQAAYVFVRSGESWSQQARLTASDSTPGDLFGECVAIDGDTIVVGAVLDGVGSNSNQGSAYAFVRSGEVWSEQAHLVAADGASFDHFGTSVGISGDTVVVGAYDDNFGRGSAYVFVRSGTTWTQQARLFDSAGANNDLFGYSVGIDGDTVIAGSFDDDVAFGNQGSAFVFARSGTIWTQQAVLLAPDPNHNDEFGLAVAISGDRVVVGAPDHDPDGAGNKGAAYVFARSAGSWAFEAKLVPSTGSSNDRFGQCIAISADTVVGGVPSPFGFGGNRGVAHVFRFKGTAWGEQARILLADGTPNDNFGASVDVVGDTIVAGAPGTAFAGNANQGAACVMIPGPSFDWFDLEEGPIDGGTAEAAGSDTSTLAITDPLQLAPVRFRCRVVNACGTTFTAPAVLTVCLADFDCSGQVGVPDIFAYLSAWFAGDPSADFDGVAGIGVPDIFAFLSDWFAGCP